MANRDYILKYNLFLYKSWHDRSHPWMEVSRCDFMYVWIVSDLTAHLKFHMWQTMYLPTDLWERLKRDYRILLSASDWIKTVRISFLFCFQQGKSELEESDISETFCVQPYFQSIFYKSLIDKWLKPKFQCILETGNAQAGAQPCQKLTFTLSPQLHLSWLLEKLTFEFR